MKFLKITYENKSKKIMFKPEYRTFKNLINTVKEITGLKKDQMKIFFSDIENDEICIDDCHDLEYFLEQSMDQLSMELKVIKNKEEEFLNISDEKKNEITEEKICDLEESSVENKTVVIENEKNCEIKELDETIILENDPMLQKAIELSLSNFDFSKKEETKIEKKEIIQIPVKPLKNERKKKTNNLKNSLKKKMKKIETNVKKQFKKVKKSVNQSFRTINNDLKDLKEMKKQLNELKKNNKNNNSKIQKPEGPTVTILTKHIGIICDECEKGPIIGKRYKCLKCPNYDLCEKCESKNTHMHPMMRLISQANNSNINLITDHCISLKNECSIKQNIVKDTKVEDEEDLEDMKKRELMDFMFESKDQEVKNEMIRRFKHLDIEEFYAEITKCL